MTSRAGTAAALAALAALCVGCTASPPEPSVEPVPEVIDASSQDGDAATGTPTPTPAPVPGPRPAPKSVFVPEPPQPVTIIVSGRQPAYADVAAELRLRYEDAAIYDLQGSPASPVSIIRQVNDAGTSAVIAIGLRAARTAVAMADAPVVFSQVFNYHAFPLLGENSRAVAAYAPLDLQLREWLTVDPEIRCIGLIIGTGHDALVAEAREVAEVHDIELRVHISSSDQETLYAFRRMSRDIDGFWLFPDSRILSARTLKEMGAIATRQRVRIAAQNDGMLKLGASLSLSSVASDVASVIADIIERIHDDGVASVPPLSALREVRVVTREPGVAHTQ